MRRCGLDRVSTPARRCDCYGNQVLIAETEQGHGILGVVDGLAPKGIEGEADIEWRKKFLRQIGYKL